MGGAVWKLREAHALHDTPCRAKRNRGAFLKVDNGKNLPVRRAEPQIGLQGCAFGQLGSWRIEDGQVHGAEHVENPSAGDGAEGTTNAGLQHGLKSIMRGALRGYWDVLIEINPGCHARSRHHNVAGAIRNLQTVGSCGRPARGRGRSREDSPSWCPKSLFGLLEFGFHGGANECGICE